MGLLTHIQTGRHRDKLLRHNLTDLDTDGSTREIGVPTPALIGITAAKSRCEWDINARSGHASFIFVVAENDLGHAVADGCVGFMFATLRLASAVEEEDQGP